MQNFDLLKRISLINYTTIKVGGKSEFFCEPNNIRELINCIRWAKINNHKCRILGAGSNVLIKNTFLSGLIICTKKIKKIIINPSTGEVSTECGVMLPTMAKQLAKNGFEGGEYAIGIPGTIGGGLFMNAGTGISTVSKNLVSVKVIDTNTLRISEIKKQNLSFKYRYSNFQKNNLIILSAKFFFNNRNHPKIIIEKTRAELKIRLKKQPYHLPSFGSVFKNPIDNYAGKLIEDSGLKGFSIGGAQVSKMHSNFIVNASNASSDEIYRLISLIQQKVQQKKGIFLHPEVRFIGF